MEKGVKDTKNTNPHSLVQEVKPHTTPVGQIQENIHSEADSANNERSDDVAVGELHIAYYLSWYCSSLMFGVLALFWVDLLPWFGTSSTIQEFGEK